MDYEIFTMRYHLPLAFEILTKLWNSDGSPKGVKQATGENKSLFGFKRQYLENQFND